MGEDDSVNIQWEQKKDIDNQERASRRLDVRKVALAEKKNKNAFSSSTPLKNLSPSLKKIKNKIKDAFDEDEDEDEADTSTIFMALPDETNSSLFEALKEDEKQRLLTQKTLENQRMQEIAGKMEAVVMADKLSKQLGLKGLKRKISHDTVQDVSLSGEAFDKAIKRDVDEKTKMKTADLSSSDSAYLIKGLKRMKQAALISEDIKEAVSESVSAKDLVAIGKSTNEKKTAKMILEKSGRKGRKNFDAKRKQQAVRKAVRNSQKSERSL